MNYRGRKELNAGLESLATVEVEVMRLELHIYPPTARVWAHDLVQWEIRSGDMLEREWTGHCCPCPYGEETKMVAMKRVAKTIHDSSAGLYYHTVYTVLKMESSERE